MRLDVPQPLARAATTILFPYQYCLFWLLALLDCLALGSAVLSLPSVDLLPGLLTSTDLLKVVVSLGGIFYMGWCATIFLRGGNSRDSWILLLAFLLPILGWYSGWWLIPLIAYSALAGLAGLCFLATHVEYAER